jgi:hypothetical protein
VPHYRRTDHRCQEEPVSCVMSGLQTLIAPPAGFAFRGANRTDAGGERVPLSGLPRPATCPAHSSWLERHTQNGSVDPALALPSLGAWRMPPVPRITANPANLAARAMSPEHRNVACTTQNRANTSTDAPKTGGEESGNALSHSPSANLRIGGPTAPERRHAARMATHTPLSRPVPELHRTSIPHARRKPSLELQQLPRQRRRAAFQARRT